MAVGNHGGRPAKPTIELVRDGTYRADRQGKRVRTDPVDGLPPIPSHLDGVAKAKFRSIGAILIKRGILTEADAGILALYAQSWSHWVEAEREITAERKRQAEIDHTWDAFDEEDDSLVHLEKRIRKLERAAKFDTAAMRRSQAERTLIEKFGARLGLSPVDVTRVHAEQPKDDTADKAARFLA